MKNKLINIFLILALVAGLSLLIYPTVSDYWNSLHASQAVASYDQAVKSMDEGKYDELLQRAGQYNRDLFLRGTLFALTDEEREDYNSQLDIDGSGVMGYIEIPTGIRGGSAIAAIAPVIDATDIDVAYGLSATFLFDMVMVVVFPILGRKLGLSDAAFGLWAGTAVNDTSSVVATGYAFSEAAGDFATMVKLTRTLAIIPTVLVFAAISLRLKRKEAQSEGASVKVNMKSVFPWFILGFLAMSGLTSLGLIPADLAAALKSVSKFLMVAALAAIGLNTDFKALCKSGAKPMLHGFIISLLVVLVAIGVEYMLGIAPTGTLA